MFEGKCVRTDGDFSMWVQPRIYRVIRAEEGFIKNIKTGENCGQVVYLCVYYYDGNGNRLQEPAYDENCYEIVKEDLNDGLYNTRI